MDVGWDVPVGVGRRRRTRSRRRVGRRRRTRSRRRVTGRARTVGRARGGVGSRGLARPRELHDMGSASRRTRSVRQPPAAPRAAGRWCRRLVPRQAEGWRHRRPAPRSSPCSPSVQARRRPLPRRPSGRRGHRRTPITGRLGSFAAAAEPPAAATARANTDDQAASTPPASGDRDDHGARFVARAGPGRATSRASSTGSRAPSASSRASSRAISSPRPIMRHPLGTAGWWP